MLNLHSISNLYGIFCTNVSTLNACLRVFLHNKRTHSILYSNQTWKYKLQSKKTTIKCTSPCSQIEHGSCHLEYLENPNLIPNPNQSLIIIQSYVPQPCIMD